MNNLFEDILNVVHKQQGITPKVHHIEVREAVVTPGGMIVYVPIKKVQSLKVLGLVAEAKR